MQRRAASGAADAFCGHLQMTLSSRATLQRNNSMYLAANYAKCGCNKLARTVRGGNPFRNLRSGIVGYVLVLLSVGVCQGTAGAQLTIDDPNGVGTTIMAGMATTSSAP